MQRRLIYILTIALVLSLVSTDGYAGKKSRGGRKSGPASAKGDKRAKTARAKTARGKTARGKTARSKAGRRKEVARRGQSGRGRRYEARSEPVSGQADLQASDATPAPRSMASGIPTDRVNEIQQALIKSGFLQGPASGQYDENTVQAMKQFQVANKLPVTGLPTAHALKRLGVAKRSNDGYAVPVRSLSEAEKKPE